jgi:YtxH-like protein
MRVPVLSVLGLAMFLAAATAAQSPKSNIITISGTVTTVPGASVENAQAILKLVTCQCSECETPECKCCPTQVVVDIQRNGRFTFTVPHGTYVLEVRSGGLSAQSTIDLTQGEQRKLDITLYWMPSESFPVKKLLPTRRSIIRKRVLSGLGYAEDFCVTHPLRVKGRHVYKKLHSSLTMLEYTPNRFNALAAAECLLFFEWCFAIRPRMADRSGELGGTVLQNRKNRNVWFVAGLGLGALAGILLAPKSGRETRKAIATGVNDGLEHVTVLGRYTRARVSNIMDLAKKSLARKKQKAVAAIDAAKKVFKAAA